MTASIALYSDPYWPAHSGGQMSYTWAYIFSAIGFVCVAALAYFIITTKVKKEKTKDGKHG